MQSNIVLGVDPGYERVGYAIVIKEERKKEEVLVSGCIRTSADDPFAARLHQIGQEIEQLISKHHPTILAIEDLYFANNAKTAMAVSQARGVIIYTASCHNLKCFEYTPLQIKSTITGSGRADKKQMMALIPRLATIHTVPKLDDEYDAIAVALTCFAREHLLACQRKR